MTYQLRATGGKIVPLPDDADLLVVGRSTNAHIRISQPGVSWHHAHLENGVDGWSLFALDTTNSTYHNDAVVPPHQRVELSEGSVIQFNGSATYTFEKSEALPSQVLDTFPGELRAFHEESSSILSDLRSAIQRQGEAISTITDDHEHLAAVVAKNNAEAAQSRSLTAQSLADLHESFERYTGRDNARYERLTSALSAAIRGAMVIGGVMGLVAFASISSEDTDKRGPLSRTIDWVGGPGEAISLVAVLISGSAWVVSKGAQIRISREGKRR